MVISLEIEANFPLPICMHLLESFTEFATAGLVPKSGPPYVMTLHGLEERRIHVMSREVKKGHAWNFNN